MRRAAVTPSLYRALRALTDAGHVWITSDQLVVGRASDGTVVTLGDLSTDENVAATERYLADHPTPEEW